MARMETSAQGKKFACAFCRGSGIQPRTSLKTLCSACRGKGEMVFEHPTIECIPCRGTGRASVSLALACMGCKGLGRRAEIGENKDDGDIMGERLKEITKRLEWTGKAVEKKAEEIKKRLEPIRPFIKEAKKETPWLRKLGNKLKATWGSLWED